MNDETSERKNTKRNGIILGVIGGALVLGGILGSYAFFQAIGTGNKNEEVSVQAGNMELIFADGNNGFEKVLEFGQSAEKTFTIKNNGSLDAIAKINWKNIVNTYLSESLTYSLSYTTEDDNTPVEVITNKSVPSSTVASKIELANGLSIPAGKTYTYTLTITLNYLESTDQTADLKAGLITEFSIEEGTLVKGPTGVETLLAKKNDVSVENYETANKGEVFSFEHEATEQTPALTDYRYVGTEPNNYIHFNDETWRIIGVFPVQSEEDGEYEQRIKIIREESLGSMTWDTTQDGTGKAVWANSSLYTMLQRYTSEPNFNYTWYSSDGTEHQTAITGITNAAKSQIAPTKWYVGDILRPGDVNHVYTNERGTTTCTTTGDCTGETINPYVIANAGIVYLSDFKYIYTSEDDSDNLNWLYENGSSWTMTIIYSKVFTASGNMGSESITPELEGNIYPVVYLCPDVEIIGGSGAQDDMYELKQM